MVESNVLGEKREQESGTAKETIEANSG